MAIYKYSRFKVCIDPESKKTQGLRVGDVVRRQYFDGKNLIYSLMIVTETGKDVIGDNDSPYFVAALIEGDEPKSGELLDFVRITSLFDRDRSGALYLTASDSDAPYMDVIDGPAFEKSLCLPSMSGGKPEVADMNKYACIGDEYLTCRYSESDLHVYRIFRLTRNSVAIIGAETYGIKQSIEKKVENPQRVIISYKVRASKAVQNVPVKFGYTDGTQFDGSETISIGKQWEYKLHLITIDYPADYQRSFSIDLTNAIINKDEWCEIAELNIVLQSDIATFADATKARVGKIKGVVDPVFGVLDGYGAYFQNLYATKNVNIAGTLTAGDENGFSSTFYVGKIHKNVILNSIDCSFQDSTAVKITNVDTPVGIGSIWQIGKSAKMVIQTKQWRTEHIAGRYCFSIWVKSSLVQTLTIRQDEHSIGQKTIDACNNWERIYFGFTIKDSLSANMILYIELPNDGLLISAPQLEYGTTPSQYQPTDGTLSYVEDYGAWFSKGGIGGTIQNPLLKLNEDGSISSRDNSFVINPDGTGHFASGRFKWTKNTIIFQDVTIRWEDFDEEAKENLSPIVMEIVSQSGFTIKNNSNNVDAKAVLYRNGSELDVNGTEYTYTWSLWDSTGTSIIQIYTGKSILVPKSEIIGKGTLSCEVT